MNLRIKKQIGGADALLETWQKTPVNKESADVPGHGVVSMLFSQAIEMSNCPEEPVINRQR